MRKVKVQHHEQRHDREGADDGRSEQYDNADDANERMAADGPAAAGRGNGAAGEIEDLRQQLQAKDEEARRNHDQYLRALADIDNIRKRLRQEKDEAIEFANADLVVHLLPVIDNFELAVQHAEGTRDFDGLMSGVTQILKQLGDTLHKVGVERIDAVGKPFDPAEHEAIGHAPSNDHPEGTVVQDLRPGYRLKGRCLRPSLVKVAGG
ncbi:MAG TPA: nucleotide exchange factor GrpE [Armatimonadota bacterium]|nr:nucleotide exchange factor GrpE [Armatimonadota bacterium]